jgi:integrase
MATSDVVVERKRKAKKRAHGEGSLRYSEAKGLWIGRLMVGTRLDGKPDIREVSAKSQKACRERLDALRARAANGTLASTDLAGLTVAGFLDKWLSAVTNSRRAATHVRYRGYVENHYKPALGTKRLGKLSHDDVQTFLDAKREAKGKRGKPLAPRTLHNLYVALGTALTWAVRKGYIAVSPMARVDAPRFVRTEVRPLTAEQTTHLLDVAEADADPLRGLWTLAAYTGMRKGELLGLTWDDVDFEAGTVEIQRSLRKVRKGVPSYEAPKTLRSRRTLDLAPDALSALQAHRDRQAFATAVLGDGYADGGMVFASERGTPLDPDNVTKRFKRALARAGLPKATRLHDLRHGTATLMLEAGETVPTVAEYLGHATPAVTMTIYAHAVPGSKKRAAERLGSILRSARPAAEPTPEASVSAG